MEQREMDNLEKVVQLVDKTGCSYVDAKRALEEHDWNILDAVVALEEEGKTVKKDPVEEPEVIRAEEAESIKPDEFKQEARGSYGRGNFGDDARHYGEQAKGAAKGFFGRVKEALTKNYIDPAARMVLGHDRPGAGHDAVRLPLPLRGEGLRQDQRKRYDGQSVAEGL